MSVIIGLFVVFSASIILGYLFNKTLSEMHKDRFGDK